MAANRRRRQREPAGERGRGDANRNGDPKPDGDRHRNAFAKCNTVTHTEPVSDRDSHGAADRRGQRRFEPARQPAHT